MTKEVKKVLINIAKYDVLCGITFTIFSLFFRKYLLSFIFFLGIITSMINFLASAVITDKVLSGSGESKELLVLTSYTLRIVIVVFIIILFSSELSNLLAFLIGFITHYVILTFATIKVQKGSE